MSKKQNCHNCMWAEIFDARPDEPSQHGCKRPGMERYVLNPDNPAHCVDPFDWRLGTPKDKRVKKLDE